MRARIRMILFQFDALNGNSIPDQFRSQITSFAHGMTEGTELPF